MAESQENKILKYSESIAETTHLFGEDNTNSTTLGRTQVSAKRLRRLSELCSDGEDKFRTGRDCNMILGERSDCGDWIVQWLTRQPMCDTASWYFLRACVVGTDNQLRYSSLYITDQAEQAYKQHKGLVDLDIPLLNLGRLSSPLDRPLQTIVDENETELGQIARPIWDLRYKFMGKLAEKEGKKLDRCRWYDDDPIVQAEFLRVACQQEPEAMEGMDVMLHPQGENINDILEKSGLLKEVSKDILRWRNLANRLPYITKLALVREKIAARLIPNFVCKTRFSHIRPFDLAYGLYFKPDNLPVTRQQNIARMNPLVQKMLRDFWPKEDR